MEFDNLIIYILLFAFFVLPSVLKGLRKKKKPAGDNKKKASLFGKLGETVQNFVRELEKQALEAKQKAEAEQQGSIWEDLADPDEIELDLNEAVHQPVPVGKPVPEFYDPEPPFVCPEKKSASTAESAMAQVCKRGSVSPGIRTGLSVHSLRQAVVWSEILGKPVALRDD